MLMTPAILAPMRPISPAKRGQVRASTEIELITSSAMSVQKRKNIVISVHGTTAWYVQPTYNAILGNFDRALTDVAWARVVTTALFTNGQSFICTR